ncbi:MAG TPA: hypothetical protein DEQ24_05445 [Enterococcus sp.]|nr:hypothetical protein [Enterococcus sp.]
MSTDLISKKVYLFIGECDATCKTRKKLISNILIHHLSDFGNIKMEDIFSDCKGKKYLPSNFGKQFSVSYSGHCFCIAISCTNVGIDIERKRKLDITHLITCFHISEQEYIKNSKLPCIQFLCFWTIKESISKYIGIGLNLDFSRSVYSTLNKVVLQDKWIKSDVFDCYIKTIELSHSFISICLPEKSEIILRTIDLNSF